MSGLSEPKANFALRHVENSQDAIVATDLNFIITAWNPAAEQIYGWTAQEALGQALALIRATPPFDEVEITLNAAIPDYEVIWTEGKWFGTVVQQHRDGRHLIINSAVTLMRDVQGQAVELVGVNREVTAQVKTEQELVRRSHQLLVANSFLENVIEQSPIGLVVFDPTGLCVRLNRTLCTIIGVGNPENIVGRYNFRQDAPLFGPEVREIAEQAFKGEYVTIPSREFDLTHLEGLFGSSLGRLTLGIKFFPIMDEAGSLQNVVALIEDMTEQRNLTNQLLQAQKMEMVGALAGGLAHDFNNMLTVLLLTSTSLRLKLQGLNGEQAESLSELAELESLGKQASDLISRLLIFTRQKIEQTQLVSWDTVLSKTATLLRRAVNENIRLEIVPTPPGLPPVKVDLSELQQVLLNLVVNARDALEEISESPDPAWQPAIRLEVFSRQFEKVPESGFYAAEDGWAGYIVLAGAERGLGATPPPRLPGGVYLACRVSDNGVGIPPKKLAQIFEPLFTTKEVGKGTGLGLAICYAVARDNGGWLQVESRPQSGARFTLYLLKASSEEVSQPVLPPSAPAQWLIPPSKEQPVRQPTAVLAEDEAGLRRVVSRVLEREGWRVLAAQDGQEALEIYRTRSGEIDLVMTDTVMPRLGGPGLVKELMALNPDLPIILMSGYVENSLELASFAPLLQSGQIRFIGKPFRMEALIEMLREVKINK